MEHSVEQVLMLYRTAPDQFGANFEHVDIVALARKVIADIYPQLEAQQQQIEMAGEHALVQGDSFAITTLLTNLIQNASKFSGEGGRIRVKLESPANSVILTVEDNGPGIPADQYDKVFERFYRIGSDRRETEVEGSGIGLAIVRHVADIHKADIKLGPSEFTTGLAVTIAFPKSLG
jgi:two-component system sensor histidine kinase QseC